MDHNGLHLAEKNFYNRIPNTTSYFMVILQQFHSMYFEDIQILILNSRNFHQLKMYKIVTYKK